MAGETTTDLVLTNIPLLTSKSVGQLVAQPWSVEARTTDEATNDITAVAKVPKGATVVGIIFQTDDLDANASEALVWSLYVGATLVKAGITNAAAQVGALYVPTGGPITVTADTFVNIKATTAAGTAAAGTVNTTPLYITES